ncbi:hypothetical protein RRF57_004455 [Xylaria bambusicola]|uniref:Uncharacterized protein n=1 Tax=Xylaria bambusicola TaxID=326684 RepID=A0AAN7ULW3_9PEZI
MVTHTAKPITVKAIKSGAGPETSRACPDAISKPAPMEEPSAMKINWRVVMTFLRSVDASSDGPGAVAAFCGIAAIA